MRLYYEQCEKHRERGLALFREGRQQEARYHLLRCAGFLFKMAGASEGALRQVRMQNASRYLALARRIKETGGRVKTGDPALPASAPAAAGEGESAGSQFLAREKPDVTFADVAGLDEVKQRIRVAMIYPLTHPAEARKFGVSIGGGMLLYGPPGTGKTLIARAVAGEIDAAFFTVKPSEVMSKWVGEAEQNVRKLFQAARERERSVIFIDEIDALAPARRDSGSEVMKRVVPQLLAELEGFDSKEQNPLLFIGATNEPWSLDPAMLRPGRFDFKVYVGLPDAEARLTMLELFLEDLPLAEDVDLAELADSLKGYSGADIKAVTDRAAEIPFIEAVEKKPEGRESRPIAAADFAAALEQVRPSVAPAEVARYRAFDD